MDRDNYWVRIARARRGRRSVLAAAAGGAGFALVGCGDDDKPKTAPTVATRAPVGGTQAAGTSAATQPPASPTVVDLTKLSDDDFYKAIPANPPKTWKDADIKTGGRETRLSLAGNVNYDFHTSAGASRGTELNTPVYSRLVRFSSAEGMKSVYDPDLAGDLATKWEQPDPQTLVFTLANGIKWQNVDPLNGRDFKVEDIAFSFDRGKTLAQSIYKANYGNFETVEAAGTNQVRLKLKSPDPLAIQRVADFSFMVMPPEIGKDADTAKTKIAGTGGFVLKSYTPNVEATFEKNPTHFKTDAQGRKLPYLDGYSLQIVADGTTANTVFEAGKAESMYGEIFPVTFDNFRDFNKRFPNHPLQMHAQGASSWNIIGHHNRPPWNDIRVRRAMNMLLPRETAIKSLFKGNGFVTPYFPWPFLFNAPPPVKDLGQWFAYNPAEAKKLLEAAGILNNSYDVDYFDSPNPAPWIPIFVQEAAQVGLKLNLVKNDAVGHSGKIAAKSWKDFAFEGRGISILDPFVTMRYHTAGQQGNTSDLDDPAVNDIFAKLVTATGDARKQLGKTLWDRMLDQVYELPIAIALARYTWSPKHKNFVSTVTTPFVVGGQCQMDSVWIDPNAKV